MEDSAKKYLEDIQTGLKSLGDGLEAKAKEFESDSEGALKNLNEAIGKISSRIGGVLQQNLDEAELQAHLGAMEARQDWDELKAQVQKATDELQASAQGKLDAAELQAHLGYMDAVDRFTEKRQEWEKEYEEKVKPQFESAMATMKDEIEGFLKSLSS
ncbi:MAG: hypothetical protein AAFU79_07280 [Myxococcota bacterium]